MGEGRQASRLLQHSALLLVRQAGEPAGDRVLLGISGARKTSSGVASCSSKVTVLATDKEQLLLGRGHVGLGFISTSSSLMALTAGDPGTGLT